MISFITKAAPGAYQIIFETNSDKLYGFVQDACRAAIDNDIDDLHMLTPQMIKKIGAIIVEHGQSDSRFKLGELIKYSPSEIEKILKEAVDNE